LCRHEDEPSSVKIVDFGISKVRQQPGVDTLTHKGTVLGTAFYMSPEQAQSFPDLDGRTDLFSVGALLYEMLAGQPPHSAPTYEAVLIAICTRDAADVRALAPDVPEKLSRVVARALRRERDERYESAQDMLSDLEAALRDSRALSTKTRAASGAWLNAPKRPGAERYRTLVFAVVAALGGFAVAAYLIARGRGASPEPVTASAPTSASAGPQPLASSAGAPAPAPSAATLASADIAKALPSPATPRGREPKPVVKKAAPAGSAGVAGTLGLSTREP
jgi:serine/threonine protein kinase